VNVPHSIKPMSEMTEFGGAYVRRRLEFNGVDRLPGSILTAADVESIPLANRTSLVNTGRIELFPAPPPSEPVARIIVSAGGGKYHVVEGRQITDAPVTKAEAVALIADAPVT